MKDFKQELKDAYNADAKRGNSNEDKRDRWKLVLRNELIKLLRSERKHTDLNLVRWLVLILSSLWITDLVYLL